MSENKKFTQNELDKIVELKKENGERITEFGQIELEILLTTQRLESLQEAKINAQKEYVSLQDQEQNLVKELNEKYGAGTVDLQSGEFIPAN
jgi:hypothetical protein